MDDYKLEFLNDYKNDGTLTVNWYMLVKFDNGDVLKVSYNDGTSNDKDVVMVINEYRLKKRKDKIDKIRCLVKIGYMMN
jgi:GH35 family endo-1,4-beta-xylanase